VNIGITSAPHTETRPRRIQRWNITMSSLIVPLLAMGAGIWLWQAELGVWVAIATLFISLILVIRAKSSWREVAVWVFGMIVIISAVDYMGWRFRLINLQGWWIGIPLFAAELFGALHVIGLQYTLYPRKPQTLEQHVDPFALPIYIMIPTVNEGIDILRKTINGALIARERYLKQHPEGQVTIVICNDGLVAGYAEWRDVEEIAELLNVTYVTRTTKGGAKAGNLENARQLLNATGNALMVIFDADQVAHPDFLVKTISPFADSRIGWVQTGQYYGNLDNSISHWAHDQQALFYKMLCPGKSNMNAMFICGTNVVLRTAALDEIGGLPQDSVTEDFAASILLHPRWRSVFIEDKLAEGIGPMDLRSYFKQQRRWAMGTLGVLRTHWKEIFLPGRGGLNINQRIQYALACTHYLSGLRDLIYVIAPIAFLITGIPAVIGSNLDSFMTHFIPYFAASQVAFFVAAWRRSGIRGIVIGFASFPILVSAIIAVVSGRKIGFQVTSKQKLKDSNLQQVRPHLAFLLLSIVALVIGLSVNYQSSSVIVTIIWIVYQIGMLGAAIGLAVADDARQLAPFRILNQTIAASFGLMTQRRTLVGAALMTGAAIVVGLVLVLPTINTPVQAFSPLINNSVVRFGVKFPHDLLDTQVTVLRDEIGTAPQIIGRTQEIDDNFDSLWAAELTAMQARPWVTLLFSQPSVDIYYASLPAIANGVHDQALQRWARAIADYQYPVYLTVLPHVDRNWSTSSAVTNNGIPADVTRAWLHIQRIFADEGAGNVAWVWSPADPINDELYAPPTDSIDLVLMSLIRYPDTEWAAPVDELTAFQSAYPNTPLFIEVSAAGSSERKTAYFTLLHDAVMNVPNLYALIYYEGSPRPGAVLSEHQEWSMLSDPLTTNAIRLMIQDITDTE